MTPAEVSATGNRICSLRAEHSVLYRQHSELGRAPETAALRWRLSAHLQELRAKQRAEAGKIYRAFGVWHALGTWVRGYREARHLFGRHPAVIDLGRADLPPHADHGSYYRTGWVTTALVSEPYMDFPGSSGYRHEMEVWAESRGLEAHFPDIPSPYYPGRTVLCVFARPGVIKLANEHRTAA